MKEFLSRQGVAYTERNVDVSDDALDGLMATGYRAIPVVEVGPGQAWGFSAGAFPDGLEELLQSAGLTG